MVAPKDHHYPNLFSIPPGIVELDGKKLNPPEGDHVSAESLSTAGQGGEETVVHELELLEKGTDEQEACERQKELAWVRYRKLLVTTILTVQVAAMVLALRYSKTSTHYVSSTAVVCSEVFKIIVCLVVLAYQHGAYLPSHIHAEIIQKPRDMVAVSVPALLYLLQNNLLFYAMERLDAALYQVTYQVKTLTTAVCTVVMLNRSISKQQWSSLILLTVGVGLAQLQPHGTRTGQAVVDEQGRGILALLVACFTSGFAGVFTEKLLKQTTASLWVRNVQLGIWSVCIGLIPILTTDSVEVRKEGFFSGYTYIVWFVVFLQGSTGICVALVMKYADNIVKNFSVALSLILATAASVPLFGFYPSGFFVVGAVLVLISVALYSITDASRLVPAWLPLFSGSRAASNTAPKLFLELELDDMQTAPKTVGAPSRMMLKGSLEVMAGFAAVVFFVATGFFLVATTPGKGHLRASAAWQVSPGVDRTTGAQVTIERPVLTEPPVHRSPRVVLLVHPGHYLRKDQFFIDYGDSIGASERVDCTTGSYHAKVPTIVVMDLSCSGSLARPELEWGYRANPLVKIVMLEHEMRITEQAWMSTRGLEDIRQHSQSYVDKLQGELFSVDVLALAYGYETIEAKKFADGLKALDTNKGKKIAEIVHNPHCAADKYFATRGDRGPRRSAVSIGHSFSLYYPLRHRLRGILAEANKSPGVFFGLAQELGHSREANFWEMNNAGVAQKQQEDYVNTLLDAKICLFDSSIFKYTVMKFYEASAAGCLIMADRPSDLADELDMFVVWIDMEMSDAMIVNKIRWWLEHDAEREARVQEGVMFARRHSCKAHFAKLSAVAM